MVNFRPRLSDLSTAQLLARALEYRRMAATATTAEIMAALLRLARRLEDKAKTPSGNDDEPNGIV